MQKTHKETEKLIIEATLDLKQGSKMCEFNVILNGKTEFKDVIYAIENGNNVSVKSITGEIKEFQNCKITEVDVSNTKLVLTPT